MSTNKTTPPQKKSIARIGALDSLRGYATVAMVIGHIDQDFMNKQINLINNFMNFFFGSFYGTQGDELFCTLIGMGIILQLFLYKKQGLDKKFIEKVIIKRGLLLILFNFFFNFVFLNIKDIWSWGILVALGFLTIFGYMFSKISQKLRFISIIIIIIVGPFIKYYFAQTYFISGFPVPFWSFAYFLRQMFIEVTFAMLPYLVFPIIGTIWGERLIEAILKDKELKFLKNLAIIGLILVICSVILSNFYEIAEYPPVFLLDLPPRFDVLRSLGIDMLLIAGFYYFQDFLNKNWKIFKFFTIFGQVSLTVFILHLLVIPKIISFFYDYQFSMYNYSVLILMGGFCAFYGILGLINSRFNRKFSLEGVMRKLNY